MSIERTPFVTDIITEIQSRVDDMQAIGEEMDAASWGYEEGVLLTGNEAIAILAELARKDAEIEALRTMLATDPKPEQRKECPNQVNGSCTLHNLFCCYPSCTYVKP